SDGQKLARPVRNKVHPLPGPFWRADGLEEVVGRVHAIFSGQGLGHATNARGDTACAHVGHRLWPRAVTHLVPGETGKLSEALLETERDQLLVQARGRTGQILQLRHTGSLHALAVEPCVTEGSDMPS